MKSTDSNKDDEKLVTKLKKIVANLERTIRQLTAENKRFRHERTELKNRIIYLEAKLTSMPRG